MTNLTDLYQEIIIDHSKAPRNFTVIPHATNWHSGHNPLCGDQITVYVDLVNNKVNAISFKGSGCAISIASASLMTEAITGKTVDAAEQMFNLFQELVTSCEQSPDLVRDLGKLAAFANVAAFPIRVKCATLAWHTLRAALSNKAT